MITDASQQAVSLLQEMDISNLSPTMKARYYSRTDIPAEKKMAYLHTELTQLKQQVKELKQLNSSRHKRTYTQPDSTEAKRCMCVL